MTKAFATYVQSATGKSIRAMSTDIGMTHTTLGAHLTADVPNIESVLKVVRFYGLQLARTFVAAGYISEEEASQFSGEKQLSEFTDLELSKEMLRRVATGHASEAITEPASEELIDDVLRQVEDAREQRKQSDYRVAADIRKDRTPGDGNQEDDRVGL